MRAPVEANTDVGLTVARPEENVAPRQRWRYLPWPLAAVLWTLGAAATAWLISAVLPVAAWVAAARTPALAVFDATGQTWLAVHGAPARLGSVMIDLMPLGITVVMIAACAAAAHHAADQYVLAPDAQAATRWKCVAAVAGTCIATYVIVALIMAPIIGGADQIGPAVAGAFGVAALGAIPGAAIGLDADPFAAAPDWAARVPRAVGAGLGVVTLGSMLAVLSAFWANWPQVQEVQATLGVDGVGAVIVTLVQAAFLPTMVLWAGSFVLGAGLRLGTGAMLAPGHVELGTLPALPAFGALPHGSSPADWAWLSVGVLAGIAAGAVMVRMTQPTWFQASWRGGLAGGLAGAAWALASWFAVGDLGTRALVGLGPRFPRLWLFAVGSLTLAGALGGVGVLTARRLRGVRAPAAAVVPQVWAADADPDEPTVPLLGEYPEEAEAITDLNALQDPRTDSAAGHQPTSAEQPPEAG